VEQKYLLWFSHIKPSREIENNVTGESFELLHTNSLPDAISYCLDLKPQLIFIDADNAQMPLVDLVSLIRRTSQSGQIISVVDSSQSELASLSLTKGGAVDFLLKPFFPEQLKLTIRNADSMKQGAEGLIAVSNKSQIGSLYS